MISDWRGERRILGSPSPLEDFWSAARLALVTISWAALAAAVAVLVRLAFGDISTVRIAIYTWAFTFFGISLLFTCCYLLLGRLWLSAFVAVALTTLIAYAVWRWALPRLMLFGWTEPSLSVIP
ncbi:MAG: hypothetical protein EON86_18620 [Brevundimonas sp.]|nr:MAG: hypothetical protein EON86_18620 [Brevundimonas sp.]